MRLLLVVALVLAAAASVGSAARQRPVLRVVSSSPLVVRGTHFAARERVTVRVATSTRLLRAAADGSFVVRFATVSGGSCTDGIVVVARGATGDVAEAKLGAQRECPPPAP